MTTTERVAAEVRAELARRRMTGRELSDLLGWSPATTARRIAGQTAFTVPELVQLAEALGVPIADLLPTPVGT